MKPRRAAGRRRRISIALARAGARAEEAIFVDDFAENIAGAQAIGMRGVHFTDPAAARRQLVDLIGVL